MVDRLLTFLTRHATSVLAACVFLGLIVPPLASALRPLLVPAVFIILSAAFYRLDWGAVAGYARRPGFVAIVSIWMLGITPFAMWAVVSAFELAPALAGALVLMAAAPPIISSMPFAQMLRLDVELAAISLFAVTIISPFTVPLIAVNLLGIDLDLDTGGLMLRLAALAGGALAVALVMRAVVPVWRREKVAHGVDGIILMALVVFAIAIMDGVTATLFERPGLVLGIAAAAFLANIVLQMLGAGAFALLGAKRALTVGLLSGNRNLALILAALAGSTDFELLLFFALGQIPIYVMPALLAPIYRRLRHAREVP